MRSIALAVLLIACTHEREPAPPVVVVKQLIDASAPDATPDAPPDATTIDPCSQCGVGTICVQAFDGRCERSTRCVTETVKCTDHECSPACAKTYCGDGMYQCRNRVLCGTESRGAFTCYGP